MKEQRKAFILLLNKRIGNESKYSITEIMAHYFDKMIKSKEEMKLKACTEKLLPYLPDKDIFCGHYAVLLKSRLLNGKTDFELEKAQVNAFRYCTTCVISMYYFHVA